MPPTAFVPRIKKKTIPRITFIEDRLIRCVPLLPPQLEAQPHGARAG